jgi:DNA primase
MDEQRENKVFVVVVEGPVDAIHVEGVALLGSEIKDQQALLINSLNRPVIVVPDRDSAGSKLVEQALDLGWGVSMPNWPNGINDVGDAVQKYGRLYALHSIVGATETSSIKIKLRKKKWFV